MLIPLNTSRSNLASALASKATSEANLLVAEKAWARSQKLFSDGVVSQADFDQSEASFKTAEANMTSASEDVCKVCDLCRLFARST